MQDKGREQSAAGSSLLGKKLRLGRAVVVPQPRCRLAVKRRLKLHRLAPSGLKDFGLDYFGRSPIRTVPGFTAGIFAQK